MIATRATVALLVRTLREEGRSIRPYAARFAIVGILFLGLVQAHSSSRWIGAPGLQLFQYIAWIDMIFICLAAVSYFATPITEEKEEQTLGLLRMTSLNPLSILLGKAGTRLLGTALLLLAQLPFTLLAITLGGVGLRQIAAAYATLLAFTMFVSALGLFCSVLLSRSRGAAGAMFLLLLTLGIGPWAVKAGINELVASRYLAQAGGTQVAIDTLCGWLIGLAPWTRLGRIMITGFDDRIFDFQVVGNIAGAFVFYGLSWLMFDRWCGTETAVGPERVGPRSATRIARRRIRGRRAWRAALVWKDFRFLCGGMFGAVGRAVIYSVVIVAIYYLNRYQNPQAFDRKLLGEIAMGVAFWGFLLECASIASRLYSEEVRWKTLGSIVILPISLRRLAYSKLLGCALSLIPAAAIFTAGTLLAPDDLNDVTREFSHSIWPWFVAVDVIVFLHLTVLLSLYLKWGALAAAFATMMLVHMAVGMIIGLMGFSRMRFDDEILAFIFTVTGVVAILVMHRWTGHRLAEQASQ